MQLQYLIYISVAVSPLAALLLMKAFIRLRRTDKGQTLKASYAHVINTLTGTEVAAEMTHRLSGNFKNSVSFGSVHNIDPLTIVKTRFSDDGKIAVSSQRVWRPKSLVTFSAEYDTKTIGTAPKFGLSVALKP